MRLARAVLGGASRAAGFGGLPLGAAALGFVAEQGLAAPTAVQRRAIPQLAGGRTLLLCGPTGSGKTLAYALPLLERLSAHEAAVRGTDPVWLRAPGRPRLLVLAPTLELSEQVHGVFKAAAHHIRHRAAILRSCDAESRRLATLARPCDVLVTTPALALRYRNAGQLVLGHATGVVLDEIEVLTKGEFRAEVRELLAGIRRRNPDLQLVVVTATVTEGVERFVAKHLGPGAAATFSGREPSVMDASNLSHSFVDVPTHERLQVAIDTLQTAARRWPRKRVLVFCNTLKCARFLGHELADNEIEHAILHGSMPPGQRSEQLRRFAGGQARVLVCTDLASRGLDFRDVAMVLNFDFPLHVTDYIHRAGRAARDPGQKGYVRSLVSRGHRQLAAEIEKSLCRTDLHRLSTNAPLPGADGRPSGVSTHPFFLDGPEAAQAAQSRRGRVQVEEKRRGGGGARVSGKRREGAHTSGQRRVRGTNTPDRPASQKRRGSAPSQGPGRPRAVVGPLRAQQKSYKRQRS